MAISRSIFSAWISRAVGLALIAAAASASAAPSPGAAARNAVEPDGSVNVPAFQLPPSPYLSEAAKKGLPRSAVDMSGVLDKFVRSGSVPRVRAGMAKATAGRVEALRQRYGVTTEEAVVGGIHGYWVRPAHARRRDRRVLLDLPGGAFLLANASSIGLMESIPVAGLSGIDVLTIDYRQAPEATFPAASEDVAAVYRALLKGHAAKDIGIFGCSAGGILTAQSLAWFQKENLPTPGAAGIFCASADARWTGDSWYWQNPIHGLSTPPSLDERFYYGAHPLTDPLLSPIQSDAVLKRFPPTLIITATRASELSSAVNTHRLLVRSGVDAELHVWDGLDHAFFLEHPDLPESREAFDVMVAFFQRHLGR